MANEVIKTQRYERGDNGEILDDFQDTPTVIDPEEIVYPHSSIKLFRTRKCYCYTGIDIKRPAKRKLSCVIYASNGKYITVEDMVSFFESYKGRKFTKSCNHCFLEDLYPTKEPHVFSTYFGS